MSLTRTSVAALTLLFITQAIAPADETRPVRQISVSGTVEAKVAPDRVIWQISLTDTNKNLQQAKQSNDQRVKAVLALRGKLQLGEGDIETGHLSVYREYEQTPRGERGGFKHFVVRRDITIRQRDLKRFDQFLDTLLASTDMEVSFHLECSRMRQVRAETRLKALKVAKEKAAAMASEMDAKLGPVLKIEEHVPQNPWQNPLSNSAFVQSTPTADQGSETFVPGALAVNVTVNVTFELR
jgi:uncharacterized protein